MGKTMGGKKKLAGTSSPALSSFFTPTGPRTIREAGEDAGSRPKMAPAADSRPEAPGEALQPALLELKEELLAGFSRVETSILEKVSAIVAPLSAQLKELKDSVATVAQTADEAMELGLATQEHGKMLQQHSEWAAERIMHLENQLRTHNVKLRGFKEGAEENTDLAIFVAGWMASVLRLEEGVAPLLDGARRLGPPRKAKNSWPRDILVRFADLRTKNRLLAEARSRGFLLHGDSKIMVYPDLSAETLEARCRMRPVTSLLAKFNFKYRWVAYAKVLVQHKGTSLLAADLETGISLLKELGVEIPSDFPQPDQRVERPEWHKAN